MRARYFCPFESSRASSQKSSLSSAAPGVCDRPGYDIFHFPSSDRGGATWGRAKRAMVYYQPTMIAPVQALGVRRDAGVLQKGLRTLRIPGKRKGGPRLWHANISAQILSLLLCFSPDPVAGRLFLAKPWCRAHLYMSSADDRGYYKRPIKLNLRLDPHRHRHQGITKRKREAITPRRPIRNPFSDVLGTEEVQPLTINVRMMIHSQ